MVPLAPGPFPRGETLSPKLHGGTPLGLDGTWTGYATGGTLLVVSGMRIFLYLHDFRVSVTFPRIKMHSVD